ncbi:GNAT family N-acetyltransferase [Flavobacteriaceae bacterium]|nr:GNAT family N-acetyltransferase [Flavobacteriaceae bacterium]MDA9254110.1 GNAT family N-acetyltransferase [Flavobacteriaceae bacterium]
MKRIIRTDNNNLDFQALITELDAYLKITDGEDHEFYSQFNSLKKINHVVVAFQNEQAIGCGAFRKFDANTVEIKRMYVKATYRGSGVANTVLSSLEQWASEEGFTKCVLETGNRQIDAIKFYKKSGYRSIPNYGQYAQMEDSNCFEKLV